MITPSPTTKIDASLARGTLAGLAEATLTKPAMIKFAVPNTSYELYLQPDGAVHANVGKRLIGIIKASARRVDVVGTGGQFVEPVFGRPRRVQGTVVAITPEAIVVDAGVTIHLSLTDSRQNPTQFSIGQLVSCDVLDGATFRSA
jgi:hypothetical protein